MMFVCVLEVGGRGEGGAQRGVGVVGAVSLLSLFRKPVLSVHHIKEDIQAIHMQMLRVI